MRLLLDTHSFLWYVLNDSQLSDTAESHISDPDNDVLVSAAVYWEIAIKVGNKKLDLKEPFDDFMDRGIRGNDFEVLPVELRHASKLITLPFHHRDPFDRILVAQALTDGLRVVSIDEKLDAYGVQRIW